IAAKTRATIKAVAAERKLTVAQWALNSAFLASPITLIIIGLIMIVSVIYMVVAAINKFTGASTSATGIIIGAFAFLGAFIWNTITGVVNAIIQFLWTSFVEPIIGIVEWVLNVFSGGFDSFGDAVKNLIGQIISWFLSLGKVVTKIIDAIFGTNWTAGLSSLQDNVLEWGKNENAITLDRTAPVVGSRIEYGDAWDAGKNFGEGIEDKISGIFDIGADDPFAAAATQDVLGDISSNTGSMADSLSSSNEDMSLLRALAEREAINQFTTAKVHVELGGVTNQVSQNTDLDGIVSYLSEALQEQLTVVAEGVD
ncbi:MAG: tail tape measure protein, partial [Candidatus Fimivivens sp.]